jgi:hypothetical protein
MPITGPVGRMRVQPAMATSYWIARPDGMAIISALSPEGVGQLLEHAEDWPTGSYPILTHRHGTAEADRPWGQATKEGSGDVVIEAIGQRGESPE